VLPDLVTARLVLTPVEPDHLDLMHLLNADESVMHDVTGRPATVEETDAEWMHRLGERSDAGRGLGYWVGWHAGAFAGWWGLGACAWDNRTANLGYRLTPGSWGNGLATEGGRALLRHAFSTVGLESVWASTTPGNRASQRVLSKLSMTYLGIRHGQCQYRVAAAEWRVGPPDCRGDGASRIPT
jgi:RimJ/RimL family protein N-acetyltransferase